MTGLALVSSIIISIGSLAWGYAGMGLVVIPRWMIAFGALWLISPWRGWRWVSPVALFLSLLFAIIGLWLSFPIGWMFSGAIFALFAWDMTELRSKMHFLAAREDAKGMERRHLARVSLLALGGLLVASMFILWWRQWTSEWGNFLLGVTLLGLTQIIAWFRK
ncbi:MAG: hypothetical protein IH589_09845 [Anaerolineales bacterium]|nr:hypothetical protein [Anaerolineales bacterium]